MRETPVEGEDATLIVEAGDRSAEDLATALEDAGATVEAHLQFDSLRVSLPQERIDALCSVDGIASITTDNAVGVEGDAGEDVG